MPPRKTRPKAKAGPPPTSPPPPPPAPDESGLRPCLGRCGKMFESRHSGNRFCPRCDRARQAGHRPRSGSTTVYPGGTPITLPTDDPRSL